MVLNEDTFSLYAAHYYDNPHCGSVEDFEEDLLRFKYIKKSFYVYKNKNDLKERLIMNHLVILYNSFNSKACTEMLLLKMKDYLEYLFPFLLALGYIDSEKIREHGIVMDVYVVNKVREILRGEQKNGF